MVLRKALAVVFSLLAVAVLASASDPLRDWLGVCFGDGFYVESDYLG